MSESIDISSTLTTRKDIQDAMNLLEGIKEKQKFSLVKVLLEAASTGIKIMPKSDLLGLDSQEVVIFVPFDTYSKMKEVAGHKED